MPKKCSYPHAGSHHYVQLHMTYAVLFHLHLMCHHCLKINDSLVLALHHNALYATQQKQYDVAIAETLLWCIFVKVRCDTTAARQQNVYKTPYRKVASFWQRNNEESLDFLWFGDVGWQVGVHVGIKTWAPECAYTLPDLHATKRWLCRNSHCHC